MTSAFVRTLAGGYDVQALLALVTTWARQYHDGHCTILAFTTGYKVTFGTPDISPGGTAYAQVQAMPQFPTLKEALVHVLLADKWSMPAAADN
jgi:hypothetical protein